MSAFGAVWKREAARAVRGSGAWAIGAATAALAAVPLLLTAGSVSAVADFGPSLVIAAWCVLVGLPLAGAASMSREHRHGTWDLLLAAPGRPSAAIWAKGAAMGVFAGVVSLALVLVGLAESFVTGVEGATIVSGTLGLVLLGMAAGSVGVLAGAVTRSGLAATALALALVAGWTLLARTLQVVGDPWIAASGFALDPIRRMQGFGEGTIEVGSALSLLLAWACCLWMAARWCDAQRKAQRAQAWRRRVAAVAIGASCLVAGLVALRGPGVEPPRADLHALLLSRAAEPLQAALSSAKAPVRFTLLRAGAIGESSIGAARQAMRRAVSSAGGPAIGEEVDLLDPKQAGRSAQVMERIEASERTAAEAWRLAFREGLAVLAQVRGAGDLADACRQAAERRPKGDLAANNLVALATALQRVSIEGGAWIEAFEAAAAASAERPLGDVEGAARSLAGELGVWARLLRQGGDAVAGPGSTREMRDAARRLGQLADACRTAQDQVDRLPPLRLTEVAAALRAPPVLVVTTGSGAAAVPAWRLVEGSAAADEAMAATLSAAEGAPRSGAIFVHASQRSPLEATSPGSDFALMADALRGARMRVEAWNPSQAPRPAARESRRRVWIVVPPLERRSLEPDAAETALLDATRRLIREGEPVFLLAAPSVAAAMGMVDPWAGLLQAEGLEARSGAMVVELAARSETERQLRTTIEEVARGDHGAALFLRGAVSWPMPVPLALREAGPWKPASVACIASKPSAWIEDDPRVISRGADRVPEDKRIPEGSCVPVLAVSESEGRRVAIAGGAAWALSATAAVPDARGALRHPGNRDLFVGTVRWLAGEGTPTPAGAALRAGSGSAPTLLLAMPALAMALVPGVLALMRRRA